ncbi:SMI1/KNR4 family protein [Pseudomonas protegens]|uniref:SMI1/KNR4 family protein n=1 Tax=Pseudomonas protegens TaxID=380021 RepID=UPI000AE73FD8|nr:SMI1/KNR4 family protein [Pseudomonas protegens]
MAGQVVQQNRSDILASFAGRAIAGCYARQDLHRHSGWRAWQDNVCADPAGFSSLLPFAQFGTGDYYCFDYAVLGEAGEPVVVLWSHETGATSVVADGYAAFLASTDRPG